MPGFHHPTAVLPLPLAVAVSVHHFRCRCRCALARSLLGVDDWLASYGTEQRKK